MKIICAWCQRDGKPSLLGEKSPLDQSDGDPQYLLGTLGTVENDKRARCLVSHQIEFRSGGNAWLNLGGIV